MRTSASVVVRRLAFCFMMCGMASSFASAADLLIELKPAASVTTGLVLLQDVAKLTCPDPASLAKAGAVEIRVLNDAHDSETITAGKVSQGLVIAGFSYEDFVMVGATSTVVSFNEPQLLSDGQVEQAALQAIVDAMGMNEKDLTVRLQNPFVSALKADIRERNGLRVEVIPPKKGVGMVMMHVQIWHDKELLTTRQTAFDVRKRHRVAIAKISLSRDMPLDDRSVQFENRFLSTEMDELDPAQVMGQQVRGNMVTGSILQMRDLQTTRPGLQPLVKKGETVRVMARAGKLNITYRNAEAMQNGTLGENIKLRNRESGQDIVGTVAGPGVVKVQIK